MCFLVVDINFIQFSPIDLPILLQLFSSQISISKIGIVCVSQKITRHFFIIRRIRMHRILVAQSTVRYLSKLRKKSGLQSQSLRKIPVMCQHQNRLCNFLDPCISNRPRFEIPNRNCISCL